MNYIVKCDKVSGVRAFEPTLTFFVPVDDKFSPIDTKLISANIMNI